MRYAYFTIGRCAPRKYSDLINRRSPTPAHPVWDVMMNGRRRRLADEVGRVDRGPARQCFGQCWLKRSTTEAGLWDSTVHLLPLRPVEGN